MNSNIQNICSKSGKEREDYYIYQFNTSCLFQYSYYIESNKQAAIIDPIIDSELYLGILKERGATLKYIFETHFHADFVSGHLELSQLTNAKIVYGPTAVTKFEAIIANDSELFQLGNVNIELIHTPGHTMESSCLLLRDSHNIPKEIFTGDCLFLGEVGRPDLAVKGELKEMDLANYLFDSLQKLKTLPDDIIVYPGHGAGSACGKKISAGSSDTLGNQKKTNYALNDNLLRQEFAEIVTSNLPIPPQYFFYDVMLNKEGLPNVSKLIEQSLNPITPQDFFQRDEDILVIDTRDSTEHANGFIKGSYLISLKIAYAIWAATLFKPENKFLLITEPGKEKEAVTRLARVGYQKVKGYVDGGYFALKNYAEKEGLSDFLVNYKIVDHTNIKQTVKEYSNIGYYFVDVREKSEWCSTGIIPNSILISLSSFEEKINEFLKLGTEKNFAVFCKLGGRAATAVSILKKYGFDNVHNIGGIQHMIDNNVELISYPTN